MDGKPSYLSADESGGYVSRLADDMEAVQLATGEDVLKLARTVLDDAMSPYAEVRYAGIRLAECLSDALRVAESRGLRLPGPDADDSGDSEDSDDSNDSGDDVVDMDAGDGTPRREDPSPTPEREPQP